VSDDDRSQQPALAKPEPEYEPPRAEEIGGEDRAATAAWIASGPLKESD